MSETKDTLQRVCKHCGKELEWIEKGCLKCGHWEHKTKRDFVNGFIPCTIRCRNGFTAEPSNKSPIKPLENQLTIKVNGQESFVFSMDTYAAMYCQDCNGYFIIEKQKADSITCPYCQRRLK